MKQNKFTTEAAIQEYINNISNKKLIAGLLRRKDKLAPEVITEIRYINKYGMDKEVKKSLKDILFLFLKQEL